MKKLLFFASLLALLSCKSTPEGKPLNLTEEVRTDAPYLVVLSMDGFRWDYPMLYDTPNLDSIAEIGVKSASLEPCFPSKTFPNHYSMATGLHPENHGIVMNSFKDPVIGRYKLSDREAVQNPNYYLGEPIWVTAEKQQMRSACYYWPGSEAPIQGYYPSIWKKYDGSVSYEARIDSVIDWLQLPVQERPHLIMWYFDEPDHVGHNYGPEHEITKQIIERLDSLVGVFCRKINSLPNKDSINLVFTSDHGMGPIDAKRAIELDQLLKEEWVERVEAGNPVVMIQPNKGFEDEVFQVLNNVEHMRVYTKETMPEAFHYTESERILDLVCVADSAWSLYWNAESYATGGTHGYDPVNRDMHAIFYATGPAFKKDMEHDSFKNIHLYSLFAKILGLDPAETDGHLTEVETMLN